tara:strand:+ start:53 stop:1165 length:1113 start_codon:yes stop_codon:yes gene_type:complete
MKNKINFAEPNIGNKEKKYLNKAFDSKWIAKGAYVNLLEKKLSKLMNTKYSLTVNNGTNAFLLILLSLKIKKGDEIIVPSFCYVSPIHMIKLMGATPVVADVEQNTYQVDPKNIIKKITKKTKAILMIHNFGGICNIEKIENIARKRKLFLIEDISETLLSKFKNKYVGTKSSNDIKKISFSSLHATKTLTTGEGGFITLNNKIDYIKLMQIRDHGIKDSSKYFYDKIGGNFRLSNLLAAIGCAQLTKVSLIRRKKIFLNNFYNMNFKNNKNLILQNEEKNSELVKWGFPVQFRTKSNKNLVLKKLNKSSTLARPSFLSLDQMKHLKLNKNTKQDFKNSKFLQDRILILPMHTKLTINNLKYICKIVNSV